MLEHLSVLKIQAQYLEYLRNALAWFWKHIVISVILRNV